ncbi:MAG: ribosome maturation factor RimM [Enterobacteriaceae bacterium]
MKKKFLKVGRIGSTYGIKGWIKMFSFTEKFNNILFYKPLLIKKNNIFNVFCIKNFRTIKSNKIIIFTSFKNNFNELKKLNKKFIYVKSDTLPKLKKNEFYYNDLLGFNVFLLNKHFLGKITDFINIKFYDILVVSNTYKNNLKNEIFIPFIYNKIIKEINIKKRFLLVNSYYESN